MAQLAIKGHETHGKEVIKILEMLGGKNSYEYSGNCIETHYYIANEEIYSTRISPINKNIFMCFTLEKFLEKFPYKIGDRVRIPEYESEVCINKMLWNGNEVLYEVVVDDEVERYSAEELNEFNEPNKDKTMNINIAITGHKTRGEEVIKILEMLGGENKEGLWGDNLNVAYYISYDNTIVCTWGCNSYTLEEFLAKFPYKIGDEVQHKGSISCDSVYEVEKMQWVNNHVEYTVKNIWHNNCYYVVTAEDLQPYKEETMETITIDDFKANTKKWLIDKLHDMVISKAIKTIGDIHEELHKPQYPKTYKECCKVLGIDSDNYLSIRNLYLDDGNEETTNYEDDLLGEFDYLWKLTICRKAYWKIAGEQMGLGKPWKPGWLDTNTQKYCIYYVGDEIKKQPMLEVHHFLAFPTKEMSDEFHENFKDLIEQCKELL